MIEGQCKKIVWDKGGWHSYQCRHKVWKDGYCKIHHPDSVKARQELSHMRWEQKREKDLLVLAHKKIAELQEKIEELEKKIEDLEGK